MKERNIKLFSTENETVKAAMVERFNRTIRGKIHRFITFKNNLRYIDEMQNFIDAYNDTVHTSTGVAPNKVDSSNIDNIWYRLYENPSNGQKHKPKLSPGDHVRISKARATFERGYTPNWSTEVFQIVSVIPNSRPVVYTIKDYSGEEVAGTFYAKELQKIKEPDSYVIESVIRSRKRKGIKELLVKWKGYPDSFNSWIKESDFV